MRSADILATASSTQERELLGVLLASPTIGLALFDLDLRYLLVNDCLAAINGMPVDAHLGRTARDVVPALAEHARDVVQRILESGEPVLDETFHGETPKEPGEDRQWSESWFPVRDKVGRIYRVACVVAETTARRRAETALRESEARFRTIAKALPGLLFVHDADGRNTFVNDGFCQLAGRDPSGLLGHRYQDLLHPDDVAAVKPQWDDCIRRRIPFSAEYRFLRHDGVWRWHAVRTTPQFDDQGSVVNWIGTALDITERRTAEEALRKKTRQLESLLTAAPIGLAFFDREHRYLQINDELAAINGMPAEAHLGRTVKELLPENAVTVGPAIDHVFASGDAMRDLQVTGETPREPGVRRHWLTGFYPVKDHEGNVGTVGAWVVEITEMRRAEERLREADQRKDEYLATLAHELRNPLAPIANGLTLLRRQGSVQDRGDGVLEIMERQVDHMVRLIDDLLDASRIATGKLQVDRETIDLVDAARHALEATHPMFLKNNVAVRTEFPAGSLHVLGDSVRLSQVITNLLTNAAKFTQSGGEVVLRVRRRDEWASIEVEDNGIGIEPDKLQTIFDLFSQFTPTGDMRSGLGIGLNLAKRLVELHGGVIHARSPGKGKGTTVEVLLPVLERTASMAATPPERVAPPGTTTSLRVLVVDDERDNADALAFLIEHEGHRVERAYDGASAVSLAASFAPDVVFLDLSMPGMSGFAVASELRRHGRGKGTRIIAVTGLGDEQTRVRVIESGFDSHLLKPLSREATLKALG